MKIVANGCSFTYGHKDSVNNQAPSWVWPSLFKDMKEITKVVNLAVEGASNDRVVRTSIEYFEKNKGIDLNNTILVVQHPTPNRGEWFHIKNKLWIGYVTTMEDVLYDISITDYHQHAVSSGSDAKAVAYSEILYKDQSVWGIGMHQNTVIAGYISVINGLNRLSI